MKRTSLFLTLAIAAITACNSNPQQQPTETVAPKDSTTVTTREANFAGVQFAVQKDLVCEMPVSAGVSDTAHYNGGVYGFCSATCKEDFLKNPASYLAKK